MNNDVVNACYAVVRAMKGVRARRRSRVGEVPPGWCPVQVYPLHIVHFMSSMFSDPSLFEIGWHISLSQWKSV